MSRMFADGFFPEVTKEDVARANRENHRVLFESELADLRFERDQAIDRCYRILNDLWVRYAESLRARLDSKHTPDDTHHASGQTAKG